MPVFEYLPKNGTALNGSVGCGKSPQNEPLAVFMYAPQIGAAATPPAAPGIGSRELAWPTQTAVLRRGVKPTNQASVKSSVVPVLPAAGQPMCAAVPVPLWTLALRIFVASAVTPSSKTFLRCGRLSWQSNLPDWDGKQTLR